MEAFCPIEGRGMKNRKRRKRRSKRMRRKERRLGGSEGK